MCLPAGAKPERIPGREAVVAQAGASASGNGGAVAVNKYVGDYLLIEDVDEKGRIKTSTEYIGKPYYYLLPEASRRTPTITICVAVALEWLLWVGAMVPFSTCMQHPYVILPFIFSVVPLYFLSETVLRIVRYPEPLEHRHADRITNRYPAACVINGILVTSSLVGGIVSLLMTGMPQTGDLIFLGCAAVMALMALLVFAKKGSFALRAGEDHAQIGPGNAE